MARQVRASRSRAVPEPPSPFATVALDRADEVVQRPPQPQEFRIFAGRQLSRGRGRLTETVRSRIRPGCGQADHAIAEIDRLVEVMGHEDHGARRWPPPASTSSCNPAASSHPARRTARPSAASSAPAPGSGRSAGAAACRRTFRTAYCRHGRAGRRCAAIPRCGQRRRPRHAARFQRQRHVPAALRHGSSALP